MKRIPLYTFIALALAAGSPSASAAMGKLSGPFTYRNLQLFLIHGDTQLESRHYATLTEALDKGLVVVKETGNVQELSIENLSKDTTVFLNAGDIVKGGRQDRTVRDDLVLPPLSGVMPLASFCVEHGRWSKRGHEDAAAFGSNTKTLSSRKEKLAARYGNDQSDVWSSVAEQQVQLNENVAQLTGKSGLDVRSPASASSLQLALENSDLGQVTKQYIEKFRPLLDQKTDVIGFVYAINGEINSAEVYNNKNLFRALWPKLLDAAVTEAITEYRPAPSSCQIADVKEFFQTAVAGPITERIISKSTRLSIHTTPTTVFFETHDMEADGAWIHKTFISKEKENTTIPLDRESSLNQQRLPPQLHSRNW